MKLPGPRSHLALDALGSPVRREIIRLLARQPQAVGQLAQQLPVSRPAVSKHLRLLENAGLVARESQGNRNYCRLQSLGFEAAKSWLDVFWDEALSRFALLAENTNTNPRRKRG